MKVVIDIPLEAPSADVLARFGPVEVTNLSASRFEGKPRRLDPDAIRDAEVLLTVYPPTNLAEMRALRWIQLTSTGYKQAVGLGLAERGVEVTNSRGCFDTAIAEWNLGMMVMLTRDVRQMIRNQDAARWALDEPFHQEMRGRTLGLWGYGGIGRETARIARQLGLRVHVLTRHGVRPRRDAYIVPGTSDVEGVLPHRTFTGDQTAEFLSGLDYLIVAMPLTSATDGLIGEREFRLLPRTAFVLNPARGAIIQEQAFIRALREGWIAGAAVDTHYQYPLPPEHPLWKFPNVILTPHISGSGESTRYPERLWDLFAQNLVRLRGGQPLLNRLTADELAGSEVGRDRWARRAHR